MNSQSSFPHVATRTGLVGLARTVALALAAGALLLPAQAAPSVQAEHDAYFPGEPITVFFADGPGGAKDWIGVYPPEEIPDGSPGSTVWKYVDNTTGGSTGLTQGSVDFPGGINLAGDWTVYLLLNDGYSLAATNFFRIVEPGLPLVRLAVRTVAPGQPISITFTNGPAGNKDWIGVYKEGQTPGPTPSTIWQYVDGTQTGTSGVANGTLVFGGGLAEPGNYVAHFMVNDGYDIIASETFSVVAPPASVGPRLLSLAPSDGSSNQPPVLRFAATITNGTSRVVPALVRLQLDGAAVTPNVTVENGLNSIAFTSPTLPAPDSSHVWVLTVVDDATPPTSLSITSTVHYGTYRNLVLPAPLVFENFDNLAEGALPAGWTAKGYTTPINELQDFGDLGSAAYSQWVAVDAERFNGRFVTYGNPENPPAWGDDYRRVLTPNPFNVVNGKALEGPLATGKFLFGNSGYQNSGASQVHYLFTRDFDLVGKTNIHVAFKSLWEQNQDSIAALEYSVDRGATWLPVAYFLAQPDIVVNDLGEIDAEATFGNAQGDVASYTDEAGNAIGGTYGAFIAATISPDLAPFIQARVDDNPSESKRVEFHRLPQADNRATVRFRFAHAGTDSWYWGIDDFGLYALVDGPVGPPMVAIRRAAAGSVDVTFEGILQAADAVAGPWSDVSGATSPWSVPSAGAGKFYRTRR